MMRGRILLCKAAISSAETCASLGGGDTTIACQSPSSGRSSPESPPSPTKPSPSSSNSRTVKRGSCGNPSTQEKVDPLPNSSSWNCFCKLLLGGLASGNCWRVSTMWAACIASAMSFSPVAKHRLQRTGVATGTFPFPFRSETGEVPIVGAAAGGGTFEGTTFNFILAHPSSDSEGATCL